MTHRWMKDVLLDLHRYARANNLPLVARDIETTLATLRAELDARGEATTEVAILTAVGRA